MTTTTKRVRIYLAGPITGLTHNEANAWREELKAELRPIARCINPLDEEPIYTGIMSVDKAYATLDTRQMVERDFSWIDECDVLLLYLLIMPTTPVGSLVELGYAIAQGKEIIAVCDNELAKHPFIAHNAKVFDTLDSAIDFIKEQYGRD